MVRYPLNTVTLCAHNTIPKNAFRPKFLDTKTSKTIHSTFKKIEEGKKANVEETLNFFKKMAEKDSKQLKAIHDNMVSEFESVHDPIVENILSLTIVEQETTDIVKVEDKNKDFYDN